ncbi:hypothetical protein F5883DRAFT_564536 [Diaporthe sp. PMI_573]|nr:hypothetical protein F5883DRAFT_564536 [Diaporthaceae sp. PMI_573]
MWLFIHLRCFVLALLTYLSTLGRASSPIDLIRDHVCENQIPSSDQSSGYYCRLLLSWKTCSEPPITGPLVALLSSCHTLIVSLTSTGLSRIVNMSGASFVYVFSRGHLGSTNTSCIIDISEPSY